MPNADEIKDLHFGEQPLIESNLRRKNRGCEECRAKAEFFCKNCGVSLCSGCALEHCPAGVRHLSFRTKK